MIDPVSIQSLLSLGSEIDTNSAPSLFKQFGSGVLGGNGANLSRFSSGFLNPQIGETFRPFGQGSLSSMGTQLQRFGNGLLNPTKGIVIRPFGNNLIDSAGRTMRPFGNGVLTNMGSSLGSQL